MQIECWTARAAYDFAAAPNPELVAVGVAVGGLADAIRIGFPIRWAQASLGELGDEPVDIVHKDQVPDVSGVLRSLLDEHEPVLGKLPHGLGIVGHE